MWFFLLFCAVVTVGLLVAFYRRERGTLWRLGPWRVLERSVAVFIMTTMTLAVVLQVAVRYLGLHDFFRAPWTDELARLMLVWCVFWGAAMLQRSDEHISMPLLVQRLKANKRRLILAAGDIAAIVLMLVLLRYGWETARSAHRIRALVLGTPMAVFHYSVPVAAALMLVFSVKNFVIRLGGGEPRSDEMIGESPDEVIGES